MNSAESIMSVMMFNHLEWVMSVIIEEWIGNGNKCVCKCLSRGLVSRLHLNSIGLGTGSLPDG